MMVLNNHLDYFLYLHKPYVLLQTQPLSVLALLVT